MSRSPAPIPGPPWRPSETTLRRLEELYLQLDRKLASFAWSCEACGDCCRLAERGHEVWLTDLELGLLAARHGLVAPRVAGVCPYLAGGRCRARAGRSLCCRIFHCAAPSAEMESLHESFVSDLRRIYRGIAREPLYGELLSSLEEHGARDDRDGDIAETSE